VVANVADVDVAAQVELFGAEHGHGGGLGVVDGCAVRCGGRRCARWCGCG
jgi:hypothetical protein